MMVSPVWEGTPPLTLSHTLFLSRSLSSSAFSIFFFHSYPSYFYFPHWSPFTFFLSFVPLLDPQGEHKTLTPFTVPPDHQLLLFKCVVLANNLSFLLPESIFFSDGAGHENKWRLLWGLLLAFFLLLTTYLMGDSRGQHVIASSWDVWITSRRDLEKVWGTEEEGTTCIWGY